MKVKDQIIFIIKDTTPILKEITIHILTDVLLLVLFSLFYVFLKFLYTYNQNASFVLGIFCLFVVFSVALHAIDEYNLKPRYRFLATMIAAFILAIGITVISANLAPIIFKHCTPLTVETPYKITASDATDYTLQAFLFIVIGLTVFEYKRRNK